MYEQEGDKSMRPFRNLSFLGAAVVVLALVLTGCGDDDSTNPVNHAPVISAITVSPSSVVAGASATVTVIASDADGNTLTYSYIPNGGAISGFGASVSWTAPSTAGTYSVAVTVTDGQGGTATGTGALTVTAASTGISGTARVAAGVQADLRNSLVRLFADYDDFQNDRTFRSVAAQGSEYSVSFTFTDLPPGTYYLDLWKDMDNSTTYTNNDLYGIYGTYQWPNPVAAPVVVLQGQMTNVGEIMLFEL